MSRVEISNNNKNNNYYIIIAILFFFLSQYLVNYSYNAFCNQTHYVFTKIKYV